TSSVSFYSSSTFNLHLLKKFLQTNFIQHGGSVTVRNFMSSSNYLDLNVLEQQKHLALPNQLTKFYESAHHDIINKFLENEKISQDELEVWYSLTILFQ